MELVFEILSYVPPYDLLKLARINKASRCLLLSRSSAFLWRISRANADDIPDPPFEFSEPADAHLSSTIAVFARIEEKAEAEGWAFEVESPHQMKGYPTGKLASNPCINRKDKNTLNEEDWLKIQPLIPEPLQQQRNVLVDRTVSGRMFLLEEAYGRFQKSYFCQHSAICSTLGDLIVTDGPIKTLIQATLLNHHPASIDSEFSMRSLETFLSSEFASTAHK
ncbi:hypothetical protein EV368DRAFT_82465 [Lentinula lateritia]|uniref:Uncharacterized protein n=1 Tax=Lentinula aff. lateritia TaxID=2804960 RepID=A0ACC1TS32_9AGAR|nr:hypothetical protein F5876DRAFT_79679 [Lentinula aff. lateritia]KAJ3852514.1 hypothetical protein EV368DRAFT_82465 [Lentinula lateritia]